MVAVDTLLAQPGLALEPLVVVNGTQQIRWVATSELSDPTPFFEGGEILLTTGIQTRDWSTRWELFVSSLVAAGTVGIGLGIGEGLTYNFAPQRLVDACRATGLNLFLVPHGTAFVAVSQCLSRLISEDEQAAAVSSLGYQRRLTAAAGQSAGEQAVLTALADILGGAVAVLSPDGVVEAGPVGDRRAELTTSTLAREVRTLDGRQGRTALTSADPEATLILQPIGDDVRSGYLAALGPARLSESQRAAVATAVGLLSLIAVQTRRATRIRQPLRDRALDLLLTGDVVTADLILGVEPGTPGLPGRARMIRAVGPNAVMSEAKRLAERAAVMVSARNDQLWILTADQQAEEVVTLLGDLEMFVGVGGAVPPESAPQSHQYAGIALSHARVGAPIVRWDEMLAQGPFALVDRPIAEQFAEAMLGDLSVEQLEILRCFLQHNGSQLKVSEALAIHRNTVRHRLAAIATQLRGSLDDPQVRANAWLALQVLPQ